MANIWWRNLLSDNDFNNINNFATTEGGTTVPAGALSDHVIFFSNTAGNAKAVLSANLTVGGLYNLSADTGGSDNCTGNGTTTGLIDLGAFTLTIDGNFKLGGTDTSNRFYVSVSNADSIISLNGTGIFADFCTVTGNAGSYDCQIDSPSSLEFSSSTAAQQTNFNVYNKSTLDFTASYYRNRIKNYKDDEGSTITILGSQALGSLIDLKGTIALGAITSIFASNDWNVGANADVTGTGIIRYSFIGSTFNFTSSKTGCFSFTGKIQTVTTNTAKRYLMSGCWSNATYEITNSSATLGIIGNIGLLQIKDFLVTSISHDFPLEMGSGIIEVFETLNLTKTSGAGTLTYTKNAETWKLKGASDTADFGSFDVGSIEVVTGASYTISNLASSNSLKADGVMIFDDSADLTANGSISGSGTIESTAGIKYISYSGNDSFDGTLVDVVLVGINDAGRAKLDDQMNTLHDYSYHY